MSLLKHLLNITFISLSNNKFNFTHMNNQVNLPIDKANIYEKTCVSKFLTQTKRWRIVLLDN